MRHETPPLLVSRLNLTNGGSGGRGDPERLGRKALIFILSGVPEMLQYRLASPLYYDHAANAHCLSLWWPNSHRSFCMRLATLEANLLPLSSPGPISVIFGLGTIFQKFNTSFFEFEGCNLSHRRVKPLL